MDMIVKTSVSVKSSKTELCLSFEEDPMMENVGRVSRRNRRTDDANVSRDTHFKHKTRT
jgi:hypothetical protein